MSSIGLLIRDSRYDQDVDALDYDSYTKRAITTDDYNYEFDAVTGGHYLSLKGLWRYIIPNEKDRTHALFQLPFNYPNEPIPEDKLLIAVRDFVKYYKLPRPPNTVGRYNWMLASAARHNGYVSIWASSVLLTPQMLIYNEFDEAFDLFFSINNIERLEIPMPPGNLFDGIGPQIFVLIWNAKGMPFDMLLHKAMKVRYSTMHVNWHMNVPHTFTYLTAEALYSHLIRNIIDDWEMYASLKTMKVQDVQRVTERLVLLNGDDHALDLNALGNLYLTTHLNQDARVAKHAQINRLLHMVKTEKDSISYAFFNHARKNWNWIWLPKDLLEAASDHPIQMEYTKFKQVPEEIMEENYGYIRPKQIGPVIWATVIDGETATSVQEYTKASSISTTWVRHLDVQPELRPIKDYFRLCATKALHDDRMREEGESKIVADNVFIAGKSRAGMHLNNVTRVRDHLSACIADRLRNVEKGMRFDNVDAYYRVFLYAYTNRAFTISDDTLIANELETSSSWNNATQKLLSLYMHAINGMNEQFFNDNEGLMSRSTFRANETILFVGAEKEPTVEIINALHASDNRTKPAKGIGALAHSPHLRATLPLTVTSNIKGDIGICDIDQEWSRFGNPDEMYNFAIMILDEMVEMCPIGYIKINHPSEYLINLMKERLHYTKADAECTLIKSNGQNMYTMEVFFYYNLNNRDINNRRWFSSETDPFIYMYEHSTAQIDFKTPEIISTIDVKSDSSNVYSMRIDINDLPLVTVLLTSRTERFRTFKIDQMQDNNTVCITASDSRTRRELALRSYQSYGDVDSIYANMPNNLGQLPYYGLSIAKYSTMPWYKILKEAMYRLIKRDIDADPDRANTERLVDIGGRNLNASVVAKDKQWHVIDPHVAQVDLEESHQIHVLRTVFDYLQTPIMHNTTYLVLFVLMNEPDGTSKIADLQITHLVMLATRVKQAFNSYLYINYYSHEAYNAFMNTTARHKVTLTNEMIGEVLQTRMSFGDYSPVDTLDNEEIFEALRARGLFPRMLFVTPKDIEQTMSDELALIKPCEHIELFLASATMPILVV
ncbi:hypothetical protein [Biston robustus cypovirus]|nr:hypothetical protein [Biston robustus cypovirus]